MALANFMSSGTYSVVTLEKYDHDAGVMDFRLSVYTDSSKTEKIVDLPYSLRKRFDLNESVLAVASTPPAEPELGDKYLVGADPTGAWSNCENMVATLGGAGWNMTSHATGAMVEDQDQSEWLVRESDGSWSVVASPFTDATWDANFDPSLFDVEDQNHIQACYDYLKTLPEFAGVSDA